MALVACFNDAPDKSFSTDRRAPLYVSSKWWALPLYGAAHNKASMPLALRPYQTCFQIFNKDMGQCSGHLGEASLTSVFNLHVAHGDRSLILHVRLQPPLHASRQGLPA